jgi:hypothetical protein
MHLLSEYESLKANARISSRNKGRFFCDSKKSDAYYGQLDAIVRCFSQLQLTLLLQSK